MKQLILLVCVIATLAACEKEKQECPGSTEKSYPLSGFTGINAAETFSVSVTKGNAYSITAKGCSNDLNDLVVTNQNNVLDIHYRKYQHNRYRVDIGITMPEIVNISLEGAASGRLNNYNAQMLPLLISLGGTATCDISQVPSDVSFNLSGTSILTVGGAAENLKGTVAGAARLSAYQAPAKKVEVQTDGTAKAYVVPTERLKATAAGASRIYYKGAPLQLEAQEKGAAKIVKE